MRVIVSLLALGAAMTAVAADPPSAPATPSATASEPAPPATAAAPAATPAAATPATPATSATTAKGPAEEADATDKRLRTAGYKPQVVNGVTVWCRTEKSIGSRLSQQKNCGTAEDLERSVRETQNRIAGEQNRQWNPTNH